LQRGELEAMTNRPTVISREGIMNLFSMVVVVLFVALTSGASRHSSSRFREWE